MSASDMSAMGPVQGQEPPDTVPMTVEQAAQNFIAVLFKDGGLDPHEMRIVQATFAEIQQRVMQQQQAGVGPDGRPLPTPQAMPPQTPASQNETDFDENPNATPMGGYQ